MELSQVSFIVYVYIYLGIKQLNNSFNKPWENSETKKNPHFWMSTNKAALHYSSFKHNFLRCLHFQGWLLAIITRYSSEVSDVELSILYFLLIANFKSSTKWHCMSGRTAQHVFGSLDFVFLITKSNIYIFVMMFVRSVISKMCNYKACIWFVGEVAGTRLMSTRMLGWFIYVVM